jgi:prepilin-type N-terminal cleavage/methylation domain-containing protein
LKTYKKDLQSAFTLIEVLISVLILSGTVVYALKIHSQNREQIVYISERSKLSLEDSLFIEDNSIKYHKDKKEAYEILRNFFNIENQKSREILKNIQRKYFIPEPIKLIADDKEVPVAIVNEIKIKDKFSSSYFHFKINSF